MGQTNHRSMSSIGLDLIFETYDVGIGLAYIRLLYDDDA